MRTIDNGMSFRLHVMHSTKTAEIYFSMPEDLNWTYSKCKYVEFPDFAAAFDILEEIKRYRDF